MTHDMYSVNRGINAQSSKFGNSETKQHENVAFLIFSVSSNILNDVPKDRERYLLEQKQNFLKGTG